MEKYNTISFEKDLGELGITITSKQLEQFLTYYEILVKWNQAMNLTTITEYNEVMKKHFIDSLSLASVFSVSSKSTLIDVGTGAGFPGLALKIAFPELKVTLLDSLKKRINFLNEVIEILELKGIETIHGRAEDYAKAGERREEFDLCASRAVANLTVLSEYCLPFVKVGGYFISYKSEKINEEMSQAYYAIDILGGKVEKQEKFLLPNSDIYRNLILIQKTKPTPKKYPRKAGVPIKEPLIRHE